MKKIICILLVFLITGLSSVGVNAYMYDQYNDIACENFKQYYEKITGGKKLESISSYLMNYYSYDYRIIHFKSEDYEDSPFFKRYGNFYESSEYTNLVYPSGYVVYDIWKDRKPFPKNDEYYLNPDNFMSVEEVFLKDEDFMYSINSVLRQYYYGKRKVGVAMVGWHNSDNMFYRETCYLTISDVTYIQKVLTKAKIYDDDIRKLDFNNDGKLDIIDATAIQRYLANI